MINDRLMIQMVELANISYLDKKKFTKINNIKEDKILKKFNFKN